MKFPQKQLPFIKFIQHKIKTKFNFYKQYENKFDAYKGLFFINDIHLNKQGNNRVANEIIQKIKF